MRESDDIREIKGIGEKKALLFNKLGVYRVSDILSFYPRTYIMYPEPVSADPVTEDCVAAVKVRVMKRPVVKNGRMSVTVACFSDLSGEGTLEGLWFRSPYIASVLKAGSVFVLYGKLQVKDGKKTFMMPALFSVSEYEELTGKPMPVYSLTAGLSNNALISAIKDALKNTVYEPVYRIPEEAAITLSLPTHERAMYGIHFPEDTEDLKRCRDRLVFEEFYCFLKRLKELKSKENTFHNIYAMPDRSYMDELLKKVPFSLTNAQRRAVSEIAADLDGDNISYRMLVGDVGSGKTIVAILAMLYVTAAGYQAAIMVPTSVLANQHFESIRDMLDNMGEKREVVLLTGKSKDKAAVRKRMAEEPGLIIVGTQALISENAAFYNLALIISDEQHRFGVRQREALGLKGEHPHELSMSATPIPRSLAMILYADMSVSVIDELPAKRLPIKSFVADESYRNSAYRFMEKEIASGHQVYVVCPMVEPSEVYEGRDVQTETERLRGIFPGRRIESLNGRMSAEKKDEVMESFACGDIDILVSTTVIEVGINVPNATFMLIENAERFGLAALHQLRGRVGRGDFQSYCVFMKGTRDEAASERLAVMGRSNDGSVIADHDLSKRGPGDLFGIRQSGEIGFVLADIYRDADLLRAAASIIKK